MKKRVIILGAAGRDFHNFFTCYKNNSGYEVVCFTAEQIPGISNRKFPKQLAGSLYKNDIPIYPESDLKNSIKKFNVDEVVLSYSDLSFQDVMKKASFVLSCGASFKLIGNKETYLKSKKKIIAVTAVRTGAGKSQVSRKIAEIIKNAGKKVVVIRHPMPYGDLIEQEVQRFETYKDLDRYKCTIEEREEYEPHIEKGIVVYAGVNYEKILREAEKEADVIIFDGGNNDESFFKPDLHITVVDPLRAGHEINYYPGMVNFLESSVLIINKVDSATKEQVGIVEDNINKYNPSATIIKAKSDVSVSNPDLIKGKKCLVVEDGPTLTHGGMSYGAGTIALRKYKGIIVDARKFAVGSIKEVYKKYPHLGKELPAMGYDEKQIKELQDTINKSNCDIVIDGSPVNLGRLIESNKKIVNVNYELGKDASEELEKIIKRFI